ncbi:amino acid ABC transporter ATP-binding/permease protein [Levilactobacillus suantsaii]|uniref:ABC transporter ATP-binding protein n=1 Tax=Levilactobacillus suantsaii TaxID=2292255 RepID=A0A4V1LFD5_9LACO|nr:ABC transporter ATP-binding protein [Levilactobacillus suantsaii]QMU07709.1 ABC transporter ATP-binding protein [Levilactobacillus suantsaii]RXI78687.1 ABC transporter ATP-binding protein [Levilactobacillus suantsaii]
MSLLKRLLQTAGRLNWILGASVVAGIAATLLQLGLLWGGFLVLFQPVAHWWLWLIILALAGGLCRFGEQYLGHLAAFKILDYLRNLTYQKLLYLAPAKLDDQRQSDVLKLLAQDIAQIETFYAHTLAPVLIGVGLAIGLTVGFWLAAPVLGVIALVAYALIGLIIPLTSRRHLATLAQQQAQADASEQRQLTALITGRQTLQQYAAISARTATLNQTTQAYWRVNRKRSLRQTQNAVGMQLVVIVSLAAVIAVVVTQQLPLILAVIFPLTFSRLLDLGNLPGTLSGGLLAARHVFAFLDESPRVVETGQAKLGPIQAVALTDVAFAYPQRPTAPILRHTDLRLRAGERVGIVGPSGAGKSTIIKLIMRWYTPDQGTIAVNDRPITTYSLDQLRQQINDVPQVAQVFDGTLRENLTLRVTAFTDAQLWQVLDWVHLTAAIRRLPDQLATQVSRDRPILSAGEVQRLELARALLHPSSLLILDEPTSNLDVVNEAVILTAVQHHYSGTVILVTHRESSLALCDRVLELNHGQLRPRQHAGNPVETKGKGGK